MYEVYYTFKQGKKSMPIVKGLTALKWLGNMPAGYVRFD